jgi:hypothetical protein
MVEEGEEGAVDAEDGVAIEGMSYSTKRDVAQIGA